MQTLMMTNPRDAYRKQGVLTASPLELIIMLYDGLKKDVVLAERAIAKRDVMAAHGYLIKAQNIVSELMNALDFNYQISEELLRIYEFILTSLQEINVKKDTTLVPPVLEIIGTLRDAWQEAGESQRGVTQMREAQG